MTDCNLTEAITAYEELLTKAEPKGQTAQTATLAIADLWRREGNTETAMNLLRPLTESTPETMDDFALEHC